MKKILLIILVCVCVALMGFQSVQETTTVKYKSYTNDRYLFTADIPSTFTIEVEPENGDGLIFISKDKLAELTVSGGNNALRYTVRDYLKFLVEGKKNISYKITKGNWIVLSWIEGNKIVYERCVVGSGSENSIYFKYPVKQKAYYSGILSHIIASFKTPGIEESH
jgi:hypothetical protein